MGLGCMGMSEFYGGAREPEAIATIHRALDLGVAMLDTADSYGLGHNERLVGKAIAGRDDAVVATKFGIVRGEDGSIRGLNGRPDYVARTVRGSLERLGRERIDLLYCHRIDPEVPLEETVGAMARLVEEGLVGEIGLSEVTAGQLRRAHAVHPVAAVQSEYSLWSRDPEAEVLPAVRDLGIRFVAFSPVGRGMLTAAAGPAESFGDDDLRRTIPRFQGENYVANRRLVDELETMAAERGITPAQLSLAWLLRQGDDIVPIPGTRTVGHLEENMAAGDVALEPEAVDRLSALFAPERIAGGRRPAAASAIDPRG
jgi:aryl-alcohol dehydrogenase-like predicted oxidoreductase